MDEGTLPNLKSLQKTPGAFPPVSASLLDSGDKPRGKMNGILPPNTARLQNARSVYKNQLYFYTLVMNNLKLFKIIPEKGQPVGSVG